MAINGRKTILVTGASSGIGKTVADRLLGRGDRVVTASLEGACCTDPEHRSLHLESFDVREESSVLELFSEMKAREMRLNALVHSAGTGLFKPLIELSVAEWEDVLKTNLQGAFLCSREATKMMIGQGGGRIIHLGSIAGDVALPDNCAYSCSKAGLRALTQSINADYAERGVLGTLMALGAVATPLWEDRPGFDIRKMIPVDAVAEAIVQVLDAPPEVRFDEVRILPRQGAL